MSADLTPAERVVDQVLAEQRAKGRAKYGKGLDYTEARDWSRMALEEAIDGMQYLAAEVRRLQRELRNARISAANVDELREAVRVQGDDIKALRAKLAEKEAQR